MLKKLITIGSFSLLTLTACGGVQNTANASNSISNAVDLSENANIRLDNSNSQAKTSVNKSNAKAFLGFLGDKRVQINLTREGNDLSGTYQYEKIGKDLQLSGTIDGAGRFTLQETDQAASKTGEWNGTWKETDGRVTLAGKWKNPKGGSELEFSADELKTEFKSGAKITTKSSHEENKAKFYAVSTEYPELSGVEAAADFNRSVKKIVDDTNSDFKKNLADYTAPEDLKSYKENGISLYDELSYSVLLANDDVISVLFNDSNFLGGAHGSYASTTLNYDLKNNRELKLADIFEPNANYLKTISELSIADLKVKMQKDEMLDTETLNEGAGAKEENFKSWNLTNKGLTINFDPYQVAAYAAGPQEVTIPYAKLQSILRKDGVAAKLAK